ncbi:hypothetical protein BDK51DRAFT_25066, partial [Blyttiomyces helicus]
IPWAVHGANQDAREAGMLCGLALALASHGAPLYRVEHRISMAADELGIPISIFSLPSTLMISVGDGSLRHPSRTQYLSVSLAFNMSKLHEADQLAKRISEIRTRKVATAGDGAGLAGGGGGGGGGRRGSAFAGRGSVVGMGRSSVVGGRSSVAMGKARVPPPPIDEILTKLDAINQEDGYPVIVRILASAVQSAMIAVLLFRASWADGIASFVLGAVTGIGVHLSHEYGFEGAIEVLMSIAVSAGAKFLAQLPFWADVSGTGFGLCTEVTEICAIAQLMPGVTITLGMLEMGSNNPVAGSVRMFQSFIRTLKLGYGITTGTRVAYYILEIFGGSNAGDVKACPTSSPSTEFIELWRSLLFIPMNIAILILLKANISQWPHMSVASVVGFGVSQVAGRFFKPDIAAGMAAFAIGTVANIHARRTNNIAIAAVLAGIFWLVPGGVGVKGAIAAFSSDSLASGTSFGIDMSTRAMSIAVGLFVANSLAFPIRVQENQPFSNQDILMTV